MQKEQIPDLGCYASCSFRIPAKKSELQHLSGLTSDGRVDGVGFRCDMCLKDSCSNPAASLQAGYRSWVQRSFLCVGGRTVA